MLTLFVCFSGPMCVNGSVIPAKFSLMKLYFGTLFEECAVNLANPEYSEGYGSSALRHWQICAL